MEDKTINLKQSVYELCSKHPEIISVMTDIGFAEVTKPGMLSTAGRFMTIPKGAKMKSFDLEHIKQKLRDAGFTVE